MRLPSGIPALRFDLRYRVRAPNLRLQENSWIDAAGRADLVVLTKQVMLMLRPTLQWEGQRLKAELEVKGVRYPVRWAGRQKVTSDGSLTLCHNHLDQVLL